MRRGAFDAVLRQVVWHLLKSRFLSFFICDSVQNSQHPNSMSHETTQCKEKKKEKTRELAGPSQKDNKNRKKQVFFILEGNAKSLCKQKEKKIEDTS
jgi:hypothetical protein